MDSISSLRLFTIPGIFLLFFSTHATSASSEPLQQNQITAMLKPLIPLAVGATIGGFAWWVRTTLNDKHNARIIEECNEYGQDTTISLVNLGGNIRQQSIKLRHPLLFKKIKERIGTDNSDISSHDLKHVCATLSKECKPPQEWGTTHFLECFAWMTAGGLIGHFATQGMHTAHDTWKPAPRIPPAQLALIK